MSINSLDISHLFDIYFLLCNLCIPHVGQRIILATDGVWDVISLADAETMVRKIYDPRKASYAVAARARELRETNRMKIDDIVCLVVDVNPDSPSRGPAPAAMPTGCGCVIA